jgi:hypothetical protein
MYEKLPLGPRRTNAAGGEWDNPTLQQQTLHLTVSSVHGCCQRTQRSSLGNVGASSLAASAHTDWVGSVEAHAAPKSDKIACSVCSSASGSDKWSDGSLPLSSRNSSSKLRPPLPPNTGAFSFPSRPESVPVVRFCLVFCDSGADPSAGDICLGSRVLPCFFVIQVRTPPQMISV